MSIQVANNEDIPALVELLNVLFQQEAEFQPNPEAQARGLGMIINNPAVGCILLWREQGQILGMVNLLYSVSTALGARVALLEDMVVRPEARNGGTGTRLLQAALAYAAEQGCQRVTLLTDEDNLSAQRFYARQGFVKSPMLPMRWLP